MDSTLWGSSIRLTPSAETGQQPGTTCYSPCTPPAAGDASHGNLLTSQQQQMRLQSAAVGELLPAVDDFLEALPDIEMHEAFDETDQLLANLLDLRPLPWPQQQQQRPVLPLAHSNTKADGCLLDLLLMP
jgi:hypothetical protein